MPYSRYGGGPQDNRNQNQGNVSPWAGGFQAGGNQTSNLPMNLLGTLINAGSAGGGINNLATSLVAQALQNKPLQIGGHNFGGPAPMNTNNMGGGPSRGGFMDRRGGDDFRRGRDHHVQSHRSSAPRRSGSFRRSRSRSRDRNRGSRRDHSDNRRNAPAAPPNKRMRAGSPKDRAPFEIYIGNYPVRFRELDVRNLFKEHGIDVTTIRLKHDGHKVFAFAETNCEEEIQKAIKTMDSKEIHGRRLRVRSSKDKDRNDKAEQKKRPPPKRELVEDDVTRHLVFAFMGFLNRQIDKDGLDEDVKTKLDQANDLLKESFDIPDDDSLKVSRNLELIFLQNNRREIPVPKEEVKEEPSEEVVKEETQPEEPPKEAEEEEENVEDEEEQNEKVEETNDDHEENDEEEELIEELGGAIGDLVEDREDPEVEEIESNEKEEDDVIIDEDTTPAIKETSARGGRGRGANRARRSRGRRGA